MVWQVELFMFYSLLFLLVFNAISWKKKQTLFFVVLCDHDIEFIKLCQMTSL